MPDTPTEPRGTLSLRTLAMPKETNPAGDIFGGWLMSQMDLAAAMTAGERARGRTATVAVDGMTFHRPVYVGDVLSCYTDIVRIGTTSLTLMVEAWVLRGRDPGERELVTRGQFTFVAIDSHGNKRPVPAE
jgi:acyl-CoA thioesterase YciA